MRRGEFSRRLGKIAGDIKALLKEAEEYVPPRTDEESKDSSGKDVGAEKDWTDEYEGWVAGPGRPRDAARRVRQRLTWRRRP